MICVEAYENDPDCLIRHWARRLRCHVLAIAYPFHLADGAPGVMPNEILAGHVT